MASSVSNGPDAAPFIRLMFIWYLAASFSLSLSLILGPSSASHSCSEDERCLLISGSQLTREDVTQNLSHTHIHTHTFRDLSNATLGCGGAICCFNLIARHGFAHKDGSLLLETAHESAELDRGQIPAGEVPP